MKSSYLILFFSISLFFSCTEKPVSTNPVTDGNLYFPPIGSTTWETSTLPEVGFDQTSCSELTTYLEETNTKGFILLKDGKIVIEEYFNSHTQNSNWYWASAGKTLTATTVGIAQQESYLSINDKTSDYLGIGWTSEMTTQENEITINHQLSMTSGLDDGVSNPDCHEPSCLHFKNDAGSRWAYHNAPYTLLQDVVSNATGTNFRDYFETKLKTPVGMDGFWTSLSDIELYWSTTRSMARFGLLVLNDFIWDEAPILTNPTYIQNLSTSSQNLNESFGYLWWLNGKNSYMLPESQYTFSGFLLPNAPSDMFAAMGKNDQRIYVIPSKNIVIIRMGEAAYNTNFALSDFDNLLWEKINAVINN